MRQPPPSYSEKFHVCPHLQGTLFKFTLGQLGSKRVPIDALHERRWRWARGPVYGERNTCKYLRETSKVLGKGFRGSPLSNFSFSRISSDSEFAPFACVLFTHRLIFTQVLKHHTQQSRSLTAVLGEGAR